jgi:hypothetical protein
MKASELRIGNWISYRGETDCYVSSLGSKGFETCREHNDLSNGSDDINEYQPIPLTEEWLLKFGFIKEGTEYYKKSNDHGDVLLFYSPRHNKYWYMAAVERVQYNSTKPIEYVHQLQNLYFGLTGEELEIK